MDSTGCNLGAWSLQSTLVVAGGDLGEVGCVIIDKHTDAVWSSDQSHHSSTSQIHYQLYHNASLTIIGNTCYALGGVDKAFTRLI